MAASHDRNVITIQLLPFFVCALVLVLSWCSIAGACNHRCYLLGNIGTLSMGAFHTERALKLGGRVLVGTRAAGPGYSYKAGPTGPANWGTLSTDWSACGTGESQSPIDISQMESPFAKTNQTLIFNHKTAHAELHVGSYQVGVVPTEDAGSVYWGDEEYKLLKFHTHFLSEHAIKSRRFPMEMHFVHKGPDGKLLVIGIVYEYGKSNMFLEKIVDELPRMIGTGAETQDLGNVSVSDINFGESYYHYSGSLTTPPCSEGVTWIVMKKKHILSRAQAKILRTAQGTESARPLQPLNGRTIYTNF